MTIRIHVKNLDTRDGAIIVVKTRSTIGFVSNEVKLNAGEETEAWIHSDQHVLVQEVSQP